MDKFENYNDSFDEFAPAYGSGAENDYFDEFDTLDSFDEVGESGDTELRLFRRRGYVPYATYRRAIRSLNSRINRLQQVIRKMGTRYGAPAGLTKKVKELEAKLNQTQQFQTLQPLLGVPKLDSIQFEGEAAKSVEKTVYEKDSILLLSLLSGGGNLGSLNLGGSSSGQNSLLPLLLLGGEGLGEGDNSQLLLLLLLLGQNS